MAGKQHREACAGLCLSPLVSQQQGLARNRGWPDEEFRAPLCWLCLNNSICALFHGHLPTLVSPHAFAFRVRRGRVQSNLRLVGSGPPVRCASSFLFPVSFLFLLLLTKKTCAGRIGEFIRLSPKILSLHILRIVKNNSQYSKKTKRYWKSLLTAN